MRIIYHEGFDRALESGLSAGAELSGAYYLQRQGWPGIGSFGNGVIFSPGRRAGGGAMGVSAVSFPYRVSVLPDAPRLTGDRNALKRVIVGGAWVMDNLTRDTKMFGIGDDDFGVRVLVTWKHATQSIEVRDAGDTVIGTATGAWDGAGWRYFEIDATRHATAGAVKVWMDDVPILDLTAVNTGDATYGYTSVEFVPGEARMDDFYAMDPEGADGGATRLGSHVASLGVNPSSDSAVAFTPNAGGNNFSRMGPPDNDADGTYTQTATSGATDLFGYQFPPEVESVVSVAVLPMTRRPSGGSARVAALARVGGTTYAQANQDTPDSAYDIKRKQWQASPATGVAWTAAELAAATFGYRSAEQTDPLRVTMCPVEALVILGAPVEPVAFTFGGQGTLSFAPILVLDERFGGQGTITAVPYSVLAFRFGGKFDSWSTGGVATEPAYEPDYRFAGAGQLRFLGAEPEVSTGRFTGQGTLVTEAINVRAYTFAAAGAIKVKVLADGRIDLLSQDVYRR